MDRQSAVLIKTKISGYERTFKFPEQTDPEAIKKHIIEAAKKHNLICDEKDIYYVGNELVSSCNTLNDVDSYLIFIANTIKNKPKEPPKTDINRSQFIDWSDMFDRGSRKH